MTIRKRKEFPTGGESLRDAAEEVDAAEERGKQAWEHAARLIVLIGQDGALELINEVSARFARSSRV